jgi:hypothetical protein
MAHFSDHSGSGATRPTRCKVSEATVIMAVHRLRQRNREMIRAEIAETVFQKSEAKVELRKGFLALSH